MNVATITFLLTVVVLLLHESLQEVVVIRDGTSRRGTRRSGVSGRRLSPILEDDQCASSETEKRKVWQSYKKLMVFGELDIKFSGHDDHHSDHCDDARKHLRVFHDHVKCLKGGYQRVMSRMVDEFTKWVNDRCSSKSVHDNFIKLSKCFKNSNLHEDLQICHDKAIATYEYILDNLQPKEQFNGVCCFINLAQRCHRIAADKSCDRNVADFAVEFIWAPFIGQLDDLCIRKYDCPGYPTVSEKLVKIFNSKVEPRDHHGFAKYYFQIIENAFSH